MKAVLIGNYGDGNTGDEALREYFLQHFSTITWQVISAAPVADQLPRLPTGIRSLCTTPWWKTLYALWNTKTIVFGGGTLFTDIESVQACFLWWVHVMIARLCGCHIIFAFQGVGPFHTKLGEWFAKHAFSMGHSLSLRDELSFSRVEKWSLNIKVVQSFDPVFSLLLNKKSENRTKNVLVIIPRMNSSEAFLLRAQNLAKESRWEQVVVVLMQHSSSNEQRVLDKLKRNISTPFTVEHADTLEELFAIVSQADFILTQRYHGGVASLACGGVCEVFSFQPGDKLSSLTPFFALSLPERISKIMALIKEGEHEVDRAFAQKPH